MRWIFRFLGGILVAILLVVVSVPFIPAQSIADLAAREISARTGRVVTIGGKVRAVFYPMLGVKTGAFTIGNPAKSRAKIPAKVLASNAADAVAENMVSGEGLVIGVAFWPLLSGKVQISELTLQAPDIRLVRGKDGRGNWELAGLMQDLGSTSRRGAPAPGAVSLAQAQVTSGRFSFVDRTTGASFAFEDVDLKLSAPDMKKRATFSGSFLFKGDRTIFSGGIDQAARFIAGGVSPLDLSAKGPLGLLSISGRAGLDPKVAELDIHTKILNTPALLKLAGQSEDIVKGYGKRAEFAGRLTVPSDGAAYIRKMTASVGANQVSGEMDIDFNGVRPRVTARLTAGDLNLAPLFGTEKQNAHGKKNRSGAQAPGWSKNRLNVDVLALVDGEVALSAASVDLGVLKLDKSRLNARLTSARLVLTLTDIAAYGGKISGKYIVNGRTGLSMGGDLSFASVDLKRLLKDLADYDRLSAQGDLGFTFLARGDSVDSLMNTLSGSGRFIAGQGELAGLDFVGMLRNLDASYRGKGSKTIFSAITGGFSIKGGVLENNDLSFRSSLLTARGDGEVDMGQQQVTYRLTPVSFSDVDPAGQGGILVPVLITGPWSGLHYKADLQGVFDTKLNQERKKVEKRLQVGAETARKNAKSKLKKQLDEAIKNGVGKLFGGVP